MVAWQQIAHETLMTADLSELWANPAALVEAAASCDGPLAIMQNGEPIALLRGYLPCPFWHWEVDDHGAWKQVQVDWPKSHYPWIVELSELPPRFDELAKELDAQGHAVLLTADGERVAELGRYRPSTFGRDRGLFQLDNPDEPHNLAATAETDALS